MTVVKPNLDLKTPIQYLKGVGPKRVQEFAKAGINHVEDLLYHFPFRYEDRREIKKISQVLPGQTALLQGEITDTQLKKTRKRNFTIFSATISDGSGYMQIIWFNQPWLEDKVKVGKKITFYGTIEKDSNTNHLMVNSPDFEIDQEDAATGIVPVYQRIRKVSGWIIKKIINSLFEHYKVNIDSAVPAGIRKKYKLITPSLAIYRIHNPPDNSDINKLNAAASPAHKSLIFDEFFMLQAGLALRKSKVHVEEKGINFKTSAKIREVLKQMLPFHLTDGQKDALKDIIQGMTSAVPMRMLLQGDVGCGKTIVALLAAAVAIENGYQVAFMAPTEILAEQHLLGIYKHLSHTRYNIGFLTGNLKLKERNLLRKKIASGDIDIIVGTHALISAGVEYHKLGLAIIDEQHRFGVLQRARLTQLNKETSPDVLIMTATPIPRSLTLTLFGDQSVSVIKEMPPGRHPIKTAVRAEGARNRINAFLLDEMKKGRQIYCVAPVIEESSKAELKTATELYDRLCKTFPGRRVGLLHGKIPPQEREITMTAFNEGEIDILAATTVIEVGIDVPNASVIMIENAERFGLAQLHQLRGRVGRGSHQSYCILMYHPTKSEDAIKRLEIMQETNDGFKIAEKDLEIRGPGDFFGTRQSGLPSIRVGNIIRDIHILQKAREEAFTYISHDNPEKKEEKAKMITVIKGQWQKRYGLVLVG